MANSHEGLLAHLMRRAGFGASGPELEALVSRNYDSVVDALLNPERFPDDDLDIYDRYHCEVDELETTSGGMWIHRMVHTKRPLVEKIALFWHHVFATGVSKGEHRLASNRQIDMFRRVGLSDFRTILLALSKDPAMIYWLDNNENHKDEPNENYGRELLELFSMGVGNYTEQDIKMAARAFTGWTFKQPIPLYTQGSYEPEFVYLEDDHDDGEKTFLGETGPFNGEDIIGIIVKQRATARFICRHIYNFFVADEPQVPSWSQIPPRDPEAVESLAQIFMDSGGEIRPVLKALFTSEFFKQAEQKRVKSPAELVAGILKLVEPSPMPESDVARYSAATAFMAQILYDPPSVEGWHTGHEWIDGGTLTERVNFAVDEVGDQSKTGVRRIIEKFATIGEGVTPTRFVDECLKSAGALSVHPDTRAAFIEHAKVIGDLTFDSDQRREESSKRIIRMLQAIVSCREYQFA